MYLGKFPSADRLDATEREVAWTYSVVSKWLIMVAVVMTVGCASFRLPAIDPTGRQLFLPKPAYTTFVDKTPGLCYPKPAYVTPPTPPRCPPPPCPPQSFPAQSCPASPKQPSTCGPPKKVCEPCSKGGSTCLPHQVKGDPRFDAQLILNPRRLVAQVGSEVVLRAGVCARDGYYITKEPIEWMLSQDSAGNFVQSSGKGRPVMHRLLQREPNGKDSSYAVSWTSPSKQFLPRDQQKASDDIWLVRGQTWTTVTSNSEGTSYVTALAPRAKGWKQRRQSSTIHWVDAKWSFPAPAIARAGETVGLTTRLIRATSGKPINGWTIRYSVESGAVAAFLPDDAKSVDVTTASGGRGSVKVAHRDQNPGVTRVGIRIFRPASSPGEDPLLVGKGSTTVTWSAPGLALRAAGPVTALADSVMTYQFDVSNPGDLPARDVTLVVDIPPEATYVSSLPAGNRFGDRIEWKLGQLESSDLRSLRLDLRASQQGQLRVCGVATSADGLQRDVCAQTDVTVPPLRIDMEAPTSVEVGQQIQYRVVVTNQSQQSLTGLVVIDRYDAGLVHESGSNPIERALGSLGPGQSSEPFGITFTAERAGTFCHRLEVVCDQGYQAQETRCVDATMPAIQPPATTAPEVTQPDLAPPLDDFPPRPELPEVSLSVVTQVEPGRTAEVGDFVTFTTTVTNSGEALVTEIRITNEFDAGLVPTNADPGNLPSQRQNSIAWIQDGLQPGGSVTRRVVCRCDQASLRACCRALVAATSDVETERDIRESDEVCLEIKAAPPEFLDDGTLSPPANGEIPGLVEPRNRNRTIGPQRCRPD